MNVAEAARDGLVEWPADYFEAAYRRDVERVQALAGSLGPIADGSDGARAMRLSVERRYDEVALAFVSAGASPNIRDGDGSSALMWTATTGNSPLAQELLHRGADHDATDQLISPDIGAFGYACPCLELAAGSILRCSIRPCARC